VFFQKPQVTLKSVGFNIHPRLNTAPDFIMGNYTMVHQYYRIVLRNPLQLPAHTSRLKKEAKIDFIAIEVFTEILDGSSGQDFDLPCLTKK
jgi:hypothetical protein